MSVEENKDLCLSFIQRICAGNVEGFAALVDDDVRWWVQGNWPGAGKYCKSEIVPIIAGVTEVFEGGLDIDITGITAEGDREAIEASPHAVMKDGRHYDNTYHFLYVVHDGKIVEAKEYLDTMVVNDALGAMFGQ